MKRQLDLLRGRKVVITGASQGIGEALARNFASRGAQVLLVARSGDRLKKIAEEIGASYLVADLSKDSDVDTLFSRCLAQLGEIDVWVNNAGKETREAFVNAPLNELRQLCRVNFEAVVLLTRMAAEYFFRRGNGHIVQLSSVSATISFPGLAAYAGSKAGVTNLTETIRLELRDCGVGFTVVAPGPVDTAMWSRFESEGGYARSALNRFRLLGFLPKISPELVAEHTVRAVASKKPFVRIPFRYAIYHILNNAPRRLIQLALIGVSLKPHDTTATQVIKDS